MTIEVNTLTEYFGDGGWGNVVIGYFAKGHVDKDIFAQLANAEFDASVSSQDIQHLWAHNVPAGRDHEGYFMEMRTQETRGRGWYPITYCDERS